MPPHPEEFNLHRCDIMHRVYEAILRWSTH